jgi:hypothetical protein
MTGITSNKGRPSRAAFPMHMDEARLIWIFIIWMNSASYIKEAFFVLQCFSVFVQSSKYNIL